MSRSSGNSFLGHGVTIAHGDGTIVDGVEVDRDAQGRTESRPDGGSGADHALDVDLEVRAQRLGHLVGSGRSVSFFESGRTADLDRARATDRDAAPCASRPCPHRRWLARRRGGQERQRRAVGPSAGSMTYGR